MFIIGRSEIVKRIKLSNFHKISVFEKNYARSGRKDDLAAYIILKTILIVLFFA